MKKSKLFYLSLIIDKDNYYYKNIAKHPYRYGLIKIKYQDIKTIALSEATRTQKVKRLQALGLK